MRHRRAGKQLSRTSSHRRALRRNMAASLLEHGAIRTTETKAKELRRFVERLITVAKKGTLHARRQVIRALQVRRAVDEDDRGYTERWIKKRSRGRTVVDVLFDEVAPRYANRPGGYTRLIRLSDRRIGDAGRQVLLQLVEEIAGQDAGAAAGTGRRKKRAARRHEAAVAASGPAAGESGTQTAEQAASDVAEQADTGEDAGDAPAGETDAESAESDAAGGSGGDEKESS